MVKLMVQTYYDLDYAIVAFVDILGFSEMVKSEIGRASCRERV